MRNTIVSLLIGTGLAALSGTAAARTNVDVGIFFGIPAPVYAPPPPVVYYPRPAYVAPPPVYYAPASVYYGAPPVYYEPHHDYGHHRGWRKQYRQHHRHPQYRHHY